MSSTKVKKLTLQYSYLLLEKDEVDDICLEQEKEIRLYIEKHYPEEYKKVFTKMETPEAHPEPKDEPDEEISKEREIKQKTKKNKDLRLLYRKIAEKTHPDKTGNSSYSELFSEASLAYEEDDLATLLNLAGNLNIELVELTQESLYLLEGNVNSLVRVIDTKKTTTAWAFHMSKSEEEKESIVQMIIGQLIGK